MSGVTCFFSYFFSIFSFFLSWWSDLVPVFWHPFTREAELACSYWQHIGLETTSVFSFQLQLSAQEYLEFAVKLQRGRQDTKN